MALKLPNDKIVYNLPEQVGVNAENIGYLAEVYKNIDELPDEWAAWKEAADETMGGYATTMGGYATTMGGYATTMGGYQTTMQGYANTMGGYQTTMDGYALQVNTWANNIAAAAVGAIAGQDIAPKTVAQTNANYTGSITTSRYGVLTLTNVYNRFMAINNVLYVILNLRINNPTESDISISAGSNLFNIEATNISAAIGSKLYDMLGNTVSTTQSPTVLIAAAKGYVFTSLTGDTMPKNAMLKITNAEANYIRGGAWMEEAVNVPAGGSVAFTGRITLTLL